MANAFDATNAPEGEPESIVVGDLSNGSVQTLFKITRQIYILPLMSLG